MPQAIRTAIPEPSGTAKRVLLVATEDWFVASHFKPLINTLAGLGLALTVAARFDRHEAELRALGVATRPLTLRRGGLNPLADIGGLIGLLRVLWSERPDVVHAVALKPVVLTALAFVLSPAKMLVLHPTGVGMMGTDQSTIGRGLARLLMAMVRALSRNRTVWVMAENPDDLAAFSAQEARAAGRVTLLGGAGVDPDQFTPLPPPAADPVRIAFIGRMVWSKGVDRLVEAQQSMLATGMHIDLVLCGEPDEGNPRAIPEATLRNWAKLTGITWLGRIADPRKIWAQAAIAVVPSRGGEGLPRALLEAAASARPLIVTDVPGCRDFVRHGSEGLVVPPDDAKALAAALAELAGDEALRVRMGAAARARFMAGYTEAHVTAAITASYQRILSALPEPQMPSGT